MFHTNNMFSHVHLGSNDVAKAKQFYDATMQVLGYKEGVLINGKLAYEGLHISKPRNGAAATVSNGFTLGFTARSLQQVLDWHKAGVENGGTAIEDAPGERCHGVFYDGTYYSGYLRDPDGNKLCAIYFPY